MVQTLNLFNAHHHCSVFKISHICQSINVWCVYPVLVLDFGIPKPPKIAKTAALTWKEVLKFVRHPLWVYCLYVSIIILCKYNHYISPEALCIWSSWIPNERVQSIISVCLDSSLMVHNVMVADGNCLNYEANQFACTMASVGWWNVVCCGRAVVSMNNGNHTIFKELNIKGFLAVFTMPSNN